MDLGGRKHVGYEVWSSLVWVEWRLLENGIGLTLFLPGFWAEDGLHEFWNLLKLERIWEVLLEEWRWSLRTVIHLVSVESENCGWFTRGGGHESSLVVWAAMCARCAGWWPKGADLLEASIAVEAVAQFVGSRPYCWGGCSSPLRRSWSSAESQLRRWGGCALFWFAGGRHLVVRDSSSRKERLHIPWDWESEPVVVLVAYGTCDLVIINRPIGVFDLAGSIDLFLKFARKKSSENSTPEFALFGVVSPLRNRDCCPLCVEFIDFFDFFVGVAGVFSEPWHRQLFLDWQACPPFFLKSSLFVPLGIALHFLTFRCRGCFDALFLVETWCLLERCAFEADECVWPWGSLSLDSYWRTFALVETRLASRHFSISIEMVASMLSGFLDYLRLRLRRGVPLGRVLSLSKYKGRAWQEFSRRGKTVKEQEVFAILMQERRGANWPKRRRASTSRDVCWVCKSCMHGHAVMCSHDAYGCAWSHEGMCMWHARDVSAHARNALSQTKLCGHERVPSESTLVGEFSVHLDYLSVKMIPLDYSVDELEEEDVPASSDVISVDLMEGRPYVTGLLEWWRDPVEVWKRRPECGIPLPR
ncbi:hypothetical protein CRG98_023131 [Punica granatum]|uniref:Uncharacterized protein n=1 Tax=Punica granatum TaxID=22663 RepID=A0A2I0JKK7_PUNGR|nr:hypothetical protein CRG98_023131 [Punica granatum]